MTIGRFLQKGENRTGFMEDAEETGTLKKEAGDRIEDTNLKRKKERKKIHFPLI